MLILNGEPFTVVGILPNDYRPGLGLFVPDVYLPIGSLLPGALLDRRPSSFDLYGRLSSGTTREQARDAFHAAAQRLDPPTQRKTRVLAVRR